MSDERMPRPDAIPSEPAPVDPPPAPGRHDPGDQGRDPGQLEFDFELEEPPRAEEPAAPGTEPASSEAAARAETAPPAPGGPGRDGGAGAAPAPATPASTPSSPAVEPPSPDVALADEASPLPGAHRGGFQRLPTAPIEVTTQSAPAEPGTEDEPTTTTAQWLMPATDPPHRGLAAWALAFSIAGLVVSLFVGWGFPIGLVGVVSAILAIRRPLESRAVAVWALVIGSVSILYSAGWLLYAAARAAVIG